MSPTWRIRLVILILTLATIGMGYVYFVLRLSPEERLAMQQAAQMQEATPTPTPEPLLQNFAQVLAISYDLDASTASQSGVLSFIAENKPGFVVLFGENISYEEAQDSVTEITNENLPDDTPMIAVDHEGGRVQRLNGDGFTVLPTWKRVCNQTVAQQQAQLASSSAELHQFGVNIVFAPMVDVADNNLILKDRVCSGDPQTVSDSAMLYVKEFQKQQILPVLKHYPGIGGATLDTHDQFTSVTIVEKDVQPFKDLLDVYPDLGVMTAHIGVDNQEAVIPCSLSFSCINQLYELYPNVTVFSDALEMKAAAYDAKNPGTEKSLDEVTIQAIMAGNTVVVFGPEVSTDQLEKILYRMKLEYTSSSEFRAKVDQSIVKIQKLREEYITTNE